MRIDLKQKLKKQATKQAISKGLKIAATLVITYGPGGVIGKVIKIATGKWVMSYVAKRIVK